MNRKPRAPLLSSRLDWIALEVILLFIVTCIYFVIIWRDESASDRTGLETFKATVDIVVRFSHLAMIFIVGLFELGGEIMLRYTHKIAQATAAGKAEGIAEGKAEGIAEGKAAVYQEIADWDRRRREAVSRGEEFTEPPPGVSQNGNVA